VAFYFYLTYQENAVQILVGLVNLSLAYTQAELIRAVLEGVASICGSVGGNQRDNSNSGNRWRRSKIWLRILADVLQTELIAPQAQEGLPEQQSGNGGVGVPNFEAAFKMLPQDSDTVQT